MRKRWALARTELVFSACMVWWRGSYNNLHLAEGGLSAFGKLCGKLRFPAGDVALQNLGAEIMEIWEYVVLFFGGIVAGSITVPFMLWDGYNYRLAERRQYCNDQRGFWRWSWDVLTS